MPILRARAAEYDSINGDKGVVPAFHLVYGTAHPNGSYGLLSDATVMEYIRVAEAQGMVVILDHQMGNASIESIMADMLAYAHYPSVHFALDPEYHTARPGSVIGSVTGFEVNRAQQLLQEYMEQQGISGKKMLMLHQFTDTMVTSRGVIHADFSHVDLVHDADGFGSPPVKRGEYAQNAQATNIPLKGFKIFLPSSTRTWGIDNPVMTPQEVLDLDPQPVAIIYQ